MVKNKCTASHSMLSYNENKKEHAKDTAIKSIIDLIDARLEDIDNFEFLINYYIYRYFIVTIFPQIIKKYLEKMNQYSNNSTNSALKMNEIFMEIYLSDEEDKKTAGLNIRDLPINVQWHMNENVEIIFSGKSYDFYESFKRSLVNLICDYQIGYIDEEESKKLAKSHAGDYKEKRKIIIKAPIDKIMYVYYLEMERIVRLDAEMARFNEDENVNITNEEFKKLCRKINK